MHAASYPLERLPFRILQTKICEDSLCTYAMKHLGEVGNKKPRRRNTLIYGIFLATSNNIAVFVAND